MPSTRRLARREEVEIVAKLAALPKDATPHDKANAVGQKPQGLEAPERKPDDLQRIKGIGKVNEGKLHGLGIFHFGQIADWSARGDPLGWHLSWPFLVASIGRTGSARRRSSPPAAMWARSRVAPTRPSTTEQARMLADKDRIFTNLYGRHGADLASARKRGTWDGTKFFLDKGRDWIVNEMKASGCADAAAPASRRA